MRLRCERSKLPSSRWGRLRQQSKHRRPQPTAAAPQSLSAALDTVWYAQTSMGARRRPRGAEAATARARLASSMRTPRGRTTLAVAASAHMRHMQRLAATRLAATRAAASAAASYSSGRSTVLAVESSTGAAASTQPEQVQCASAQEAGPEAGEQSRRSPTSDRIEALQQPCASAQEAEPEAGEQSRRIPTSGRVEALQQPCASAQEAEPEAGEQPRRSPTSDRVEALQQCLAAADHRRRRAERALTVCRLRLRAVETAEKRRLESEKAKQQRAASEGRALWTARAQWEGRVDAALLLLEQVQEQCTEQAGQVEDALARTQAAEEDAALARCALKHKGREILRAVGEGKSIAPATDTTGDGWPGLSPAKAVALSEPISALRWRRIRRDLSDLSVGIEDILEGQPSSPFQVGSAVFSPMTPTNAAKWEPTP